MQLEVNSIGYEDFTTSSATISLDTIARSFQFTAIATEGKPLPFKGGEPCRVTIDGDPVVTGFIEIVDVDYDSRSHSINIQGRGKTGDLVDSSLEPIEINAPISLKKIIELVVAQIKIDIIVIDNTSIEDFNAAEDKLGPAVGENAFEFIERLARKRQVLLTSDGDSNIVITLAEQEEISASLQNIIQDDQNNIKSASVNYDHTERFRDYVVMSQQNTSSLIFGGSVDLSAVVDQRGSASDTGVRESRKLVLRAEKASSADQAQERATWEGNIRRTRSSIYSATVVGHSAKKGLLWDVNKVIPIVDEFADINASMLINNVEFNVSTADGTTTTLGFVAKDSYSQSLAEPSPVENVGTNLFGGSV